MLLFNFTIVSRWKIKVAIANKVLNDNKISLFVQANAKNNSAKFQFYPPYSF